MCRGWAHVGRALLCQHAILIAIVTSSIRAAEPSGDSLLIALLLVNIAAKPPGEDFSAAHSRLLIGRLTASELAPKSCAKCGPAARWRSPYGHQDEAVGSSLLTKAAPPKAAARFWVRSVITSVAHGFLNAFVYCR